MSESTLKIDWQDEIVTITIHRPEVLNALNHQVISELHTALDEVAAKPKIRAVILQSSGAKAFVAGADIAGMSKMNADEAKAFAEHGQKLTRKLENLPQVVVAKVQGFALGGGCELAMACDIIIAAESAKFGQPEVTLGLIPGFGGTQRLVRRVGLSVGLDMLIGGRNLSGSEAFQLGLVSRCCPDADLDQEVNKTVKRILKGGPQAIGTTKILARQAYANNLDAGLGLEAKAFAQCFRDEESRDGMQSFLEKRSASFAR